MLSRTAQATAAAAVGAKLEPLLGDGASPEKKTELVWDVHGHLAGVAGSPEERITQLLKYADRIGIDRLIVCMGLSFSAPSEILRCAQDDVVAV